MRSFQTILLISLFFSFYSCSGTKKEEDKSEVKKETNGKDAGVYGIESGILETIYPETASKEILYFDKWGTREARYSYTVLEPTKKEILTKLKITIGVTSYDIDMVAKEGLKLENPFGESALGDVAEVLGYRDIRQAKMLGYLKLPNEKFNGKECEVWTQEAEGISSKKYFFKGILLSEVITVDGTPMTASQLTFKENVKIPEEKFKIPDGIKY